MMLLDLHVHTTHTQPWGSASGGTLSHKEAIQQAKAAGIDAVCFTERQRPAGMEEAFAAGKAENFPVFVGVDIPALRGRIVFIPDDPNNPEFLAAAWADRTVPLTAEELAVLLSPHGVVVLVTPYHREVGRAAMCDRAFIIPNVHAIEAFTGFSGNDEIAEELAVELAVARALTVVGGSDVTDDPTFIGKCATLLRSTPASQKHLCDMLRSGDAWSIQIGRKPSASDERPRFDGPRDDDRRGPRR